MITVVRDLSTSAVASIVANLSVINGLAGKVGSCWLFKSGDGVL